MTDLNSNDAIAACTAPLLTTVNSFHASSASASATTFSSSSSQIQSALNDLCSAPACDHGLVRALLGQFNGNCSAELQSSNQVVLGSYDALYVLSPLRDAVCSRDDSGGYCVDDIASRSMPTTSTGTNATSVVASVAASNSAAAASSASAVPSAAVVGDATNSTVPALKSNFAILAATSDAGADYSIPVPAPPSLYVQITKVARRLLRRQWASGSGGVAPASATSTGVPAAAASPVGISDAGVHAFDVPSILPDAQTWSASNLPFLFLSPNMSSSVLCSSCTKTILSSYVAWESRMPYALGLANSPLLSGQGNLWTGLGQVCGSGFLQAVTQQAGETALAGGALSSVSRVGAATIVGLASVVAFTLYL